MMRYRLLAVLPHLLITVVALMGLIIFEYKDPLFWSGCITAYAGLSFVIRRRLQHPLPTLPDLVVEKSGKRVNLFRLLSPWANCLMLVFLVGDFFFFILPLADNLVYVCQIIYNRRRRTWYLALSGNTLFFNDKRYAPLEISSLTSIDFDALTQRIALRTKSSLSVTLDYLGFDAEDIDHLLKRVIRQTGTSLELSINLQQRLGVRANEGQTAIEIPPTV